MATFYSNETANLALTPPQKIADVAQRGRQKLNRNTFTLAAQASGSLLYLGRIPNGARFNKLQVTNSVSLGSSTLAVGYTPAAYNDFLAAITFTGVDTPSHQGKSAAMGATPFSADTDIYAIVAAAALPGAGTLVIDIEYIES